MTIDPDHLDYASFDTVSDRVMGEYTEKQCKWFWTNYRDADGQPLPTPLYGFNPQCNKPGGCPNASGCSIFASNKNSALCNACWEPRDEEWLQWKKIALLNYERRKQAKIDQIRDFFASLSPEDQERFAKYKNISLNNAPLTREKLEMWEYVDKRRAEWMANI